MLVPKRALQTKADELSTILLKLEHVSDDFWRSADEPMAAIFEQEIDESNPIRVFKDMRDVHMVLKDVSEALQSLTGSWKTRASDFNEKVEDFGCRIKKLTRNCGLNRLPDELLLEILAYVAVSVESTVTLSRVSRRFRSIIIGCRRLWRFRLLDRWTPEQILAVAQRRGFESLHAVISARQQDGQLRDSTKTILDLHAHLKVLSIAKLDRSSAENVRWYFLDGRMQQLQDLSFFWDDRREFIPSLSFPGVCHLPSLRVMSTDFIPHPSLSGNLVKCTIRCPRFLGDLLKFLSCASMLQHLCVYMMSSRFSDREATSNMGSISLPSLVSLSISSITGSNAIFVRNLIGKIVPFTAEKLSLHIGIGNDNISDLFTLLQGTPAIRELKIDTDRWLQIDLARLFVLIPVHLRILSLRVSKIVSSSPDGTRFKAHRLRLLRFVIVHVLTPACVIALRDFFLTFADEDFLFEFNSCKDMKNGAFRLRDVESAFKEP